MAAKPPLMIFASSVHIVGIIFLGVGMCAGVFTGSCNWVKVVSSSTTLSSHFGIWRLSDRGSTAACFWCCRAYPSSFQPDGKLMGARAGTILAPLLGLATILIGFADKKYVRLASITAILAAIFAGLTLLVSTSVVCEALEDDPDAYCQTDISTWAYWVAQWTLAAYLIGAVVEIVSAVLASTEAQPETQQSPMVSAPVETDAHPEETALPAANEPISGGVELGEGVVQKKTTVSRVDEHGRTVTTTTVVTTQQEKVEP